ncbi:DUF4270 family protein [Spirosoma areae]
MRILWYAGLLWLTGIVLLACQSGDLTVGQSVINPQELQVQSIDSITVQASTVLKPDSFVTSGDPDLLVGRWTDAQTGQLTARTFVSLDYPGNSLATQTNVRLDSLVLELNYSFAYGDTTSLFDLSVHTLTKPLVGQTYYNTNSVDYESKPLGQKTVVPQPFSRTRQVRFRLSDALTQAFYAKILNGEINDFTTLSDFLPGFALVGNSRTNTFIGFSTATSGLRLYYHSTDIDQAATTLLFPLGAQQSRFSTNFTQLQNDRTGTVLSALKNRSDAVSSRLTNNMTFVVPGGQLQTRIEFPYLSNFTRPERFADINKALLVVSPIRQDSRDNTFPPSQLALFVTNSQNEILPISIPGGETGALAAVASYNQRYISGGNPNDPGPLTLTDAYVFDLTYYIGQIIKQKTQNQPLLLSVLTPEQAQQLMQSITLRNRIQRVTLGSQQRPNDQLQLKLFITSGT